MPPSPPVIPDKLYFRIGDVAKLCAVPAYVLRFWETEFPQLKPNKGGTGQRLYRRRDVEIALRIKSLLYEQGYTIAGARQVFAAESRTNDSKARETVEAATQAPSTPSPLPAEEFSREENRSPEEIGSASHETGFAGAGKPAFPGPNESGLANSDNAVSDRDQRRRHEKLVALREELRALVSQLAQPLAPVTAGDPAGTALAEAGAVAARPRTMRPHLVLEAKAETKSGIRHSDQGDLFASE